MSFKYLIFDVDDTLLNFRLAYSHGQQAVAEALGVGFSPEFAHVDEELGWKYWGEYQLDNTDSPDVQRHYHTYYSAYLQKHFSVLAETFGCSMDVERLIQAYFKAIAASRELMEEDTLAVYSSLSERYQMVVATNGLGQVQRSRIQDFLPVTARVFISEEVGYIKPAREFFDHIVSELRFDPKDCLMVGDSLSNDMKGAKSAGMAVCWYNAKQRPLPEDFSLDYTVESIAGLRQFL